MPSKLRIAPELDLLILSFPMHFTWEFLQAPLFSSMQNVSHVDGIRICLQATLGDMAIVLSAYWATSLISGTRRWMARPTSRSVALWLAIGISITVALEFFNTEFTEGWTYGPSMPRLPFIGTGLAPVAQWIAVPLVVQWYMRRLSGKALSSDLSDRQADDGA